jgi:hypothetical protein
MPGKIDAAPHHAPYTKATTLTATMTTPTACNFPLKRRIGANRAWGRDFIKAPQAAQVKA